MIYEHHPATTAGARGAKNPPGSLSFFQIITIGPKSKDFVIILFLKK